jgi:hypothetical protein
MPRPDQERLRSLCKQAANEPDQAKVWELAREINRILTEKEGLAKPYTKEPEIGDRVTVAGQSGEFVVSGVNRKAEAVELKQVGQDFALSTIAWDSLRFQ